MEIDKSAIRRVISDRIIPVSAARHGEMRSGSLYLAGSGASRLLTGPDQRPLSSMSLAGSKHGFLNNQIHSPDFRF